MRINASWFGLHWPTEYKYVGASVCVRRQAPLGYGYQCFGPIARVCLSAISLLDGLARSSKVDQDGHGPPHSILRQSAAVLDVVKTRPGNGGACLDVGATAGLDDICARRRGLSTVGAEGCLQRAYGLARLQLPRQSGHQIGRCRLPREGLDNLLRQPFCGRMPGHREPQQLPPSVADNDEGKQTLEVHGWNHAQIDRSDRLRVIVQERPPALGGWTPSSHHILCMDRPCGASWMWRSGDNWSRASVFGLLKGVFAP